ARPEPRPTSPSPSRSCDSRRRWTSCCRPRAVAGQRIPEMAGLRDHKSRASRSPGTKQALLDLRFLEFDVLAHLWIIFAHHHFLGLRARVLLGHIEEARVGGADELDLDGCRLGHRA